MHHETEPGTALALDPKGHSCPDTDDYDRSVTMSLRGRAKSPDAAAAVTALLTRLTETGGKATNKFRTAVEAVCADLLKAASFHPVRPCFRPMRAASFSAGPVGHHVARRALNGLEAQQYITINLGGPESRLASRIRVTGKLVDHFASHGIMPASRVEHFEYGSTGHQIPAIQLRARSTRKRLDVTRGSLMEIDWTDPTVIARAEPICSLREFLARQTISGPPGTDLDDFVLYRCFNDGDQDGHGFSKGGRTYARFQSLEREKRAFIRINDEATEEVDVSACFLTLLHYFLGREFDPTTDPYAGPDLPRDIIKAWINLTISKSGYPPRWPARTRKKLEENGFPQLSKQFPIQKLKDQILPFIPIVKDWCESRFGWADLHFIESEIMVEAMTWLAVDHGVPSLPVHDALRVPVSKVDLAKQAIRRAFKEKTGINPKI